MLRIEFETENAAFEDDGMFSECAAILRAVAHKIESGALEGKVLDGNGNAIGTFTVED